MDYIDSRTTCQRENCQGRKRKNHRPHIKVGGNAEEEEQQDPRNYVTIMHVYTSDILTRIVDLVFMKNLMSTCAYHRVFN